MNPSQQKRNSGLIISVVGVIALLLIISGVYLAYSRTETTPVTETTQTPTTQTDTNAVTSSGSSGDGNTTISTQTTPVTSKYKDGTYTATGTYRTPESTESIAVTLTLKNDIVVAVEETQTAQDRESRQYQSKFAAGYKQYVVGKKIDSISLTRVSGSSLTPIGFNKALQTIKNEAQA